MILHLQVLLSQMHYIILIFVARCRHNFRETAVKNCEKSKNHLKHTYTYLLTVGAKTWCVYVFALDAFSVRA